MDELLRELIAKVEEVADMTRENRLQRIAHETNITQLMSALLLTSDIDLNKLLNTYKTMRDTRGDTVVSFDDQRETKDTIAIILKLQQVRASFDAN